MQNAVSVNEVHATGKIIATGKDRRGYSTITIVIRSRKPAIVRFVIDRLDPTIGIGSNVTITGYAKAYAYHDEIQNKWKQIQYFVATDIHKNETELMEVFGVPGRHYKETVFRAYVRGTVAYTFDTKDPNWGKLTVRVEGTGSDRRPSFITFSYHKDRHLPEFKYEKGEEVCVVASISTPIKELNGRQVPFENLMVEDIARVAPEEQKEIYNDPDSDPI